VSEKVVPIRTRHKTWRGMVQSATEIQEVVRGCIIWFDKDDVMHFGEMNMRRSDVSMMHAYTTMLAVEMMRLED
jgi:hypothetical protein